MTQLAKTLEAIEQRVAQLALSRNDKQQIAPHQKAAAVIRQRLKEVGSARAAMRYEDLRKARRLFRQKTDTGGTYPTRTMQDFYRFTEWEGWVQDYVATQTVDNLDARQYIWVMYSGKAQSVTEQASKPTVSHGFNSNTIVFNKLAFTDLISEEVLLSYDTFADYLAWFASVELENRISDVLAIGILGAGTALNTAPYSTSVTQANVYDVFWLAIRQYLSTRPQSPDEPQAPPVALIPSSWYAQKGLVKTSLGEYVQPAWAEQIEWLPHPLQGSPSQLGGVFSANDVTLFISSDVRIELNRVVESSNERNLYRFVAEVYILPLFRQANAGLYTPIAFNIPAAISAINKP